MKNLRHPVPAYLLPWPCSRVVACLAVFAALWTSVFAQDRSIIRPASNLSNFGSIINTSFGIKAEPVAEVVEGGTLVFTVTMPALRRTDIRFGYSVSISGAQPSAAMRSALQTVMIPAGRTTATISVPTTDDAVQNGVRIVTVTLIKPFEGALLSPASAQGRVLDNDPPLSAPVAQISIIGGRQTVEGGELGFSVRREPGGIDRPTRLIVEIDAPQGTIEGNRTIEVDIPSQRSTASFSVRTIDDALVNGTRSVSAQVIKVSGRHRIEIATALGRVADNDPEQTSAQVSVLGGSQTVEGGILQFEVLQAPARASGSNRVVVEIDAPAGSLSGKRRLALDILGDVERTPFALTTVNDEVVNGDRLVRVQIVRANGRLIIADAVATATILDNDTVIIPPEPQSPIGNESAPADADSKPFPKPETEKETEDQTGNGTAAVGDIDKEIAGPVVVPLDGKDKNTDIGAKAVEAHKPSWWNPLDLDPRMSLFVGLFALAGLLAASFAAGVRWVFPPFYGLNFLLPPEPISVTAQVGPGSAIKASVPSIDVDLGHPLTAEPNPLPILSAETRDD